MEEPTITALQHYYDKQETATRECLLALKSIVLSVDENIVHKRKYQIPFFCYNEFNLGFLWVHRKRILVGFIEDKKVQSETISRQKKDSVFTMEINPLEDIPIDIIKENFGGLIKKYSHYKVTG
ncbi:DUF1801 domain-containing protein [uncultured Chryseobacterium sp.]|jgi:Domain of unknown function (DU1801).|uniref:DUF1801 domain-containing protein n=1 Tax=uncultured Chryseobacterium sp. TaxID=259322 RepID=UPI00260164AA|nr:DUF1801 domain-containing protein [uncultured Chryseobacterium sp.]